MRPHVPNATLLVVTGMINATNSSRHITSSFRLVPNYFNGCLSVIEKKPGRGCTLTTMPQITELQIQGNMISIIIEKQNKT